MPNQPAKFMVMDMFPNLMRWFKIRMMNPTGEKFFFKLAEGLVKQRQNSTLDHNDVMHNLVKASKEDPELMTPNMMILTISQFFTDGYWTFTEVFTGIMYMVTVHPEVQVRILLPKRTIGQWTIYSKPKSDRN